MSSCRTSADCALAEGYSQHFEQMRIEAQAVLAAQSHELMRLTQQHNKLLPYVHRLNRLEERQLQVEEQANAAREVLLERMDPALLYDFAAELGRHLMHQPSAFKAVLPAAQRAARSAGVPDALREYERCLRSDHRMYRQALQLRYHAEKIGPLLREIQRASESLRVKYGIVSGMRVPNATCCPEGTPAAGRCRAAPEDCSLVGTMGFNSKAPHEPPLTPAQVAALKQKYFGVR